ncbi:MAG: hypothetical protein AAGF01_27370 [Cyanobacteria bacterium P01_G01_bin.38]
MKRYILLSLVIMLGFGAIAPAAQACPQGDLLENSTILRNPTPAFL